MIEIDEVCHKFGLSLDELRTLLSETDAARGMVTREDFGAALAEVIKVYVGALGSAAERFVDPVERRIADRVVGLTVDLLSSQLTSAPFVRN